MADSTEVIVGLEKKGDGTPFFEGDDITLIGAGEGGVLGARSPAERPAEVWLQ